MTTEPIESILSKGDPFDGGIESIIGVCVPRTDRFGSTQGVVLPAADPLATGINANLTEDTNLERTTRNAHAVIGFGMGGSLAIKAAAHRRRLQAAVAICATLPTDAELAQRLYCPLLLQTPGKSVLNSAEEHDQFSQMAKEAGKKIEVRSYPEASDEFWQSSTPSYRASDMEEALQTSIDFINAIINKTI